MNILIAPDSFKHSLSAHNVAEHIRIGIFRIFPDAFIHVIPLSDGGEGFMEVLTEASSGSYRTVASFDALMHKTESCIGISGDGKTVFIELAEAAGIEKIAPEDRNPWLTTTYGVGKLIQKALYTDCERIIIGAGGSATIDGGAGIARALGVKLLDRGKREIKNGGGALINLHNIDLKDVDARIFEKKIILACDVTNPLIGENGAALVYGPQKGADSNMCQRLDKNLTHFAMIIQRTNGKDVFHMPGAGAAGGVAAVLSGLFNAEIVSGFDVVKTFTQLETKMTGCDMVITGEGKMDFQTRFENPFYLLR